MPPKRSEEPSPPPYTPLDPSSTPHSPPPSTSSAGHTPRRIPIGPHPFASLPSSLEDLHPIPPIPAARQDFVAAAMRTPRDYAVVIKAIKELDRVAENTRRQKVWNELGISLIDINNAALIAVGKGPDDTWRQSIQAVVNAGLGERSGSGSGSGSRSGVEVGDSEESGVGDSSLESEEGVVKKKKKKGKGKGKKAKMDIPNDEDNTPSSGTADIGSDEQGQVMDNGGMGVSPGTDEDIAVSGPVKLSGKKLKEAKRAARAETRAKEFAAVAEKAREEREAESSAQAQAEGHAAGLLDIASELGIDVEFGVHDQPAAEVHTNLPLESISHQPTESYIEDEIDDDDAHSDTTSMTIRDDTPRAISEVADDTPLPSPTAQIAPAQDMTSSKEGSVDSEEAIVLEDVEHTKRAPLIRLHKRASTLPISLQLPYYQVDEIESRSIINLPSASPRAASAPTMMMLRTDRAQANATAAAAELLDPGNFPSTIGPTLSPTDVSPIIISPDTGSDVASDRADDGHFTIPSFRFSSPSKNDERAASPTPTETDGEEGDIEGDRGVQTVSLVSTFSLLGRGNTISPTGSDESFSSAQLAQLTSFTPREPTTDPRSIESLEEVSTAIIDDIPSSPTDLGGGETASEPATPISTISSLPVTPNTPITHIPIPTNQLISDPPHRYLTPTPTFGSPLRFEVHPHEIANTPAPEYQTAQSWSLFFSDTDKTRASRKSSSPHAPTAEAYQDGLVPIFTANNLFDLFGKWKALRRQIAISTGRSIEYPNMIIELGEMGLGAHFMNDDNNFHFFKEGVKPMWEDEYCCRGGKFMFAGNGKTMDSLFFDFILLLISDALSDLCPPPIGSGMEVVGVSLARRSINTRVEIWLGGLRVPDPVWIKKVQEVFVKEAKGERVYDYKPFHSPVTGGGRSGTSSNTGVGRTGSSGNIGGRDNSGGSGLSRGGGIGGGVMIGSGRVGGGGGGGQAQGMGQGMMGNIKGGGPVLMRNATLGRALSMGA